MLEVPLPKCIINIAEILERPKSYADLLVEGGLLEDHQKLMKIEKRIVSVSAVYRLTRQISFSTNDTEVNSLESLLWVKPQRIINSAGFFILDILILTQKDCVEDTCRELITEYNINLQSEYEGRRSPPHRKIRDPSTNIGEHLAAFLSQYGEIVGTCCNSLIGGWSFEIMLDQKAFLLIPNQSRGPDVAGHCDRPQTNMLEVWRG